MANTWEINQTFDLKKGISGLTVWPYAFPVVGNEHAHTWNVEVLDGGVPAELAGKITAYFIRSDGSTVFATGAMVGNTASVVFPAECYAYDGDLKALMEFTNDNMNVTLSAVLFNIRTGRTDRIVDPENLIPSIEELLRQVAEMKTATNSANAAASSANSAASNASTATTNANNATSKANTATSSANTAAKNAQDAADRANNVAQAKYPLYDTTGQNTDWPMTQKATTDAIEKAVDGIEVGGTNLLIGSKDFYGSAIGQGLIDSKYHDLSVSHISKLTESKVETGYWLNFCTLDNDTDYTLSFYARGKGTITSYLAGGVVASGHNSDGTVTNSADGSIRHDLSDDWERYWITWRTNSNASNADYVNLICARFLTIGYEAWICAPKFERGNKATDWTPSTVDIQNDIGILRFGPGGVQYGKEITESWESLQERVQAGDFSGINIGDYKTIQLTTNETVVCEVAGIDQYYKCGDTSIGHHIDFISRDCLMDIRAFNIDDNNNGTDTYTNPWRASELFKVMNGTVFNTLPSDLQSCIIQKRAQIESRYSTTGKLNNDNDWNWIDIGNLWLPTEIEVFGTSHWSDGGYGTSGGGCNLQYPIFIGGTKHIIKGNGNGGTRCGWWEASARRESSTHFCVVGNTGFSASAPATNSSTRVPLCFRIG